MRRLVLLLLFASLLRAAEDRLTAIRALLVPMRTAPVTNTRGATPALTDVKHQLRDWIESQLTAFEWKDAGWTPSPAVLQDQLNDELSRAGLFCQDAACPQNRLGYLDRVLLEIQSGLLVVRTSLGFRSAGPMTRPTFTYRLTIGGAESGRASKITTRRRRISRSGSSKSEFRQAIGAPSLAAPSI